MASARGFVRASVLLIAFTCLGSVALAAEPLQALTRAEREACRFEVERFFAAERAAATPGAKARMPERSRIGPLLEDELRMESALAAHHGIRIDAAALQAELERIQRESRAPGQLQRLYAALGGDARLAGECVARPILVERLLAKRHLARHGEKSDFAAWWQAERHAHLPALPAGLSQPLRFRTLKSGVPSPVKAGNGTGVEEWLVDPSDTGPFAPRGGALSAWNGSELFLYGGRGPSGALRADGGLYNPAIDHWRPTSRVGAPSAREFGVAVWTGTHFLVWGGRADSSGALYDPLDDAWSPMSTAGAPGDGQYATGVWTGSELLVFGGVVAQEARYDPATDTWTPLPASNLPFLLPTSVWLDGRMYVWGLRSENLGEILTSALGAFDPASNQWIPLNQSGAPSARGSLPMAVLDGRIVMFGSSDFFGTVHGDGAVYDPVADDWTALPSEGAPSPRFGHTLVSSGTQAIVFGGESQVPGDAGAIYDLASDSWLPLPSSDGPAPRKDHAAVWTGASMLVLGGCNLSNECRFDDGALYDPVADAWTPIVAEDDAGLVAGAAAVWTGAEALLFGGVSMITERLQRGLAWRAATESFSRLPLDGSPSARQGAQAVWTGSELLVWGGRTDFSQFFADGARFDPASRSWAPIGSIDEPSARVGHTMVWTGQQAIVLGGFNWVDGVLADGAGYDPQSDTWTPLPSEGAPSARLDAAAVWTGDTMVVWGGSNGGALDTGARFDPQSWSWIGPTAPGPGPRSRHSAVWTGSEVLVWGGTASSFPLLIRYLPASNSWTPGPFVEPASSLGQSAVWSGSELIVWGGAGSGGRFNPLSGTWRDVTAVGAPTPRLAHAALWTGQAMLVIGGSAVSQRVGLYYPNGQPVQVFASGFEP